MRIILAPNTFKESLSASAACAAIERGIRRVFPNAMIDSIPMADGGDGMVDALVGATGGELRHTRVTGPLGDPVEAAWGMLGDGSETAVIELAAASGLALVPPEMRNPLLTTTFGTGELIRVAIEAGAKRLIVGIGGSATNDGGTGAAQAMGVKFFDDENNLLPTPMIGGMLDKIENIELPSRKRNWPSISSLLSPNTFSLITFGNFALGFPTPLTDPAMEQASRELEAHGAFVSVACDVDNPLCGPRGAAAVYGPQKGATPEQVEILDRNLAHLADVIARELGRDVRDRPGAGAAGGMGAGMVAFFNARLERGIRIVMEAVRFEERISGADLIITGEGRLDRQSMMGKVIEGVGRAGRAAGVPVIALAGSLGEGAEETLEVLHRYEVITPPGLARQEAFARTAQSLEESAARLLSQYT